MKVLMRLLGIAVLFSALQACGSTGIDPMKPSELDPSLAYVTVMRKSQMTGAAGTVSVTLDTKTIGKLGTGERIEFQVAPGKHFVSVPLWTVMGMVEPVEGFDAQAGEKYYFHYSMSIWGETCRFKRLTSEEGQRELTQHKYRVVALTAEP